MATTVRLGFHAAAGAVALWACLALAKPARLIAPLVAPALASSFAAWSSAASEKDRTTFLGRRKV